MSSNLLLSGAPNEIVVPFMGDSVPDGNLASVLKSKQLQSARDCFRVFRLPHARTSCMIRCNSLGLMVGKAIDDFGVSRHLICLLLVKYEISQKWLISALFRNT